MQQFSETIAKVVGQIKNDSCQTIMEQWPLIVGRSCFKSCRPVELQNKTLLINVKSSACMFMLRVKQALILKRIKEISSQRIEKLRFRIGE